MFLELMFSAIAVYGCAAAYKGGKSLFGGHSNCGLQGSDGKYEFRGKKYDTLEEYSAAEWRQMERDRLERVDEVIARGGIGPLDEAELRAKVKEWDKKGI